MARGISDALAFLKLRWIGHIVSHFPAIKSYQDEYVVNMILIKSQNDAYKLILFCFLCFKNYFRSYGYAKNFCLDKSKNN
jgi:hypothetical protein